MVQKAIDPIRPDFRFHLYLDKIVQEYLDLFSVMIMLTFCSNFCQSSIELEQFRQQFASNRDSESRKYNFQSRD
jgi:hypothetical protein